MTSRRSEIVAWRDRADWGALLLGGSGTVRSRRAQALELLVLGGVVVLTGLGILLTVSGLPIHRRYMVVLFPLPFIWFARLTDLPRIGHGRMRDQTEQGA